MTDAPNATGNATAGFRAQALQTRRSLAAVREISAQIETQLVKAEASAALLRVEEERKRAAYNARMSAPSGPAGATETPPMAVQTPPVAEKETTNG